MYKTKEAAIRNLQQGKNFETKPFDFFRNDKEVVLEAIRIDPSFYFASSELRKDKSFCMEAIRISPYSFAFASKELRADKELALQATKRWTTPHRPSHLDFYLIEVFCKPGTSLAMSNSILIAASDEIKAICEGQNYIEVLEAAIRQEKFQSALQDKPEVKRKKTF